MLPTTLRGGTLEFTRWPAHQSKTKCKNQYNPVETITIILPRALKGENPWHRIIIKFSGDLRRPPGPIPCPQHSQCGAGYWRFCATVVWMEISMGRYSTATLGSCPMFNHTDCEGKNISTNQTLLYGNFCLLPLVLSLCCSRRSLRSIFSTPSHPGIENSNKILLWPVLTTE